jgi:hypothetical protein
VGCAACLGVERCGSRSGRGGAPIYLSRCFSDSAIWRITSHVSSVGCPGFRRRGRSHRRTGSFPARSRSHSSRSGPLRGSGRPLDSELALLQNRIWLGQSRVAPLSVNRTGRFPACRWNRRASFSAHSNGSRRTASLGRTARRETIHVPPWRSLRPVIFPAPVATCVESVRFPQDSAAAHRAKGHARRCRERAVVAAQTSCRRMALARGRQAV